MLLGRSSDRRFDAFPAFPLRHQRLSGLHFWQRKFQSVALNHLNGRGKFGNPRSLARRVERFECSVFLRYLEHLSAAGGHLRLQVVRVPCGGQR